MARRTEDLVGVVLAAGAGTRLWPLTDERPKALCPVGGVPLVDLALARVGRYVEESAVNLRHHGDQLDAHLRTDVHRSWERDEALGTAGALGALRSWAGGRSVLLANGDAWLDATLDLGGFVDGWDGERTRLLCVEDPARGDFGPLRYCGVALIPSVTVQGLEPVPSGLYEVSWRSERAADRLDLVATDARFIDCGTPADYLAANLASSGGASVVDPSAVLGAGAEIVRSVVWDGAEVGAGERLVDAVRTPMRTVYLR